MTVSVAAGALVPESCREVGARAVNALASEAFTRDPRQNRPGRAQGSEGEWRPQGYGGRDGGKGAGEAVPGDPPAPGSWGQGRGEAWVVVPQRQG